MEKAWAGRFGDGRFGVVRQLALILLARMVIVVLGFAMVGLASTREAE